MTIKSKIKPNEELYGDFELIPLNLDAVQQRIDFFKKNVNKYLFSGSTYDDKFYAYYNAMNFWIGMREEHCERD